MKTRDVLRITLIVIITILAAWALLKAVNLLSGVILLIILAIFFAYLIVPLVDLAETLFQQVKFKIPRPLAIGLVYLGLAIGLWLSLSFLLPYLGDQVGQLQKQAPGYVEGIKGKAKQYNELYTQKLPENVREGIQKRAKEKIDEVATSAATYAASELPTIIFGVIGGLAHYLPWLFLVPILAFFLLKDAGDFRASALEMLPRGRWRWRGDELFQDLNRTLAAYIRAQVIACLLIGSVCTIGFLALGVPYALLLGLLAGFLEFIPLVGPLVVAIIAILLTFIITTSASKAGVVLLFLLVLRLIHDYVTYPRIIGQGIHLHPLAVVLSVLGGAELAGLPGIFLAIPVVAIITVLHRHWLEHRGSEGLVADILATPQPPAKRGRKKDEDEQTRPTSNTTPEEMARRRPDLMTGELRLDKPESGE